MPTVVCPGRGALFVPRPARAQLIPHFVRERLILGGPGNLVEQLAVRRRASLLSDVCIDGGIILGIRQHAGHALASSQCSYGVW
jgi:hypothetical protein